MAEKLKDRQANRLAKQSTPDRRRATLYDEKSCGVVLFREKDGITLYLLLHYPSGHWDLPKGHVGREKTNMKLRHANSWKKREFPTSNLWKVLEKKFPISIEKKNDLLENKLCFSWRKPIWKA